MMKRLVLTMKVAKYQTGDQDDFDSRVFLFSHLRKGTPDLEILHNEQGLLQVLLPLGQTSLTTGQTEWLQAEETITGYECELLDEHSLQVLRTQILSMRTQGIEHSATSLEEVKAIATLQREENGVEWWTQNFHSNVHYIVAEGLVYIRYGYWGQTLYNWLVHGCKMYDLQKELWWF